MASRTSTPSRSRSSSNSSSSSDTTMIDAPPQSPSRPARLRNPSHSAALPTPTTSQIQTHDLQPDPSFSLLLSLPRELRDRIYTYALVSKTPLLWPATAPTSVYSKPRDVNVNLLRTSKQVHDEAVEVWYTQNKFLFTHPSDCTVFRVVTSAASANIANVYFRIKDRDLGLWSAYMGSTKEERSLRADLPKLRNLWVFLRLAMCPHFISGILTRSQHVNVGPIGGGQAVLGGGVQAVQNAIGQIHAIAQNINQIIANGPQIVGGAGGHALTTGNANQIPPPPPPAPAMPFPQFMQGALGLGGHAHHHHPGHAVPHAHGQHNHPPNPSPLAQHLQAQQNNPTVHIIQAPAQNAPPATSGANSTDANGLYASLIRSNRFKVVESLCLQLHDVLHPKRYPSTPSSPSVETLPSSGKSFSTTTTITTESTSPTPTTEIKIVCIARPGKRQIERLLSTFPDELEVDPITQDARTQFRKMHGVEVSWEFNGLSDVDLGMVGAGEVIIPWEGGW